MGLKIWLALASMLMVLDIVYGAASDLTCTPGVVGGSLTCTCAANAADTAGAGDTTWKFGTDTPGGSGVKKNTYTKTGLVAGDDNKDVKCTAAGSQESAAVKSVVKDAIAPTITCTPAPKVGVQTTCTCAKAAGNTGTPINCKLKIGSGAAKPDAACDALTYTPVAADKDMKIFCMAIFAGPKDSPVSGAGVAIAGPTAQAKPSITGASETATADVTLTCKAADATATGLTYKWFKDASTTAIANQAGSTLMVKQCDATKDKVYTYTCKVTNAAGDSPASDGAKVKFTEAGKDCPTKAPDDSAAGFRPSLVILGSILLLTTILLKQ